ncbi:hypothetical protein [uncultured Clostridium sp.]|uniref:hypothetical protein n=1 Tax=uncultured Clostridium sp. TaxID=59620 RepID=UPI00261F54D8|nr:hypothetical protein [uncultured Clostridium sp.]
MKTFLKIGSCFLFLLAIIAFIKTLFSGNLNLILGCFNALVFSSCLFLKVVKSMENKIINLFFWLSCGIIILTDILEIFFNIVLFK